jgi:ABC-type antimicrobial peptide transport system permease subunit
MNLATARSQNRAREVGIRKVIGSTRRSLVWRFLGESNLLALLALLLSMLLITLLLPWFNLLTDKQLTLSFQNPVYWLIGFGVSLAAGLLGGVYPAFYLSSFQPIRVLKSTLQAGKSAALPRKILVTLQFTLSITLVISVIVINQQLQYTQYRATGYDRNNLVMADYNDELVKNYEVLRRELLNSGFVSSVGRTQAPITEIRNFNEVGWRPARTGGMVTVNADHDYLSTFNVRLKRGRGFSRDFITDSSAVLLNESAVKMMGLDNPIGEEVVFWGKTYHVIGVIEDILMGSPYEAIEPAGVFFTTTTLRKVNIRYREGVNIQAALVKTAEIFSEYSPSYPFDYQFVDDEYNKKFAAEVRVSYLADTFAVLAIFISCLGLFGLATHTAQTRTREIGIRKVLGAKIGGIVLLLSQEYVLLIGLSLPVASPLAWYFLENWLQNYPYRIQISGWVFVLAGASALGIALLTVSYQSVKAALANPVQSLRSE